MPYKFPFSLFCLLHGGTSSSRFLMNTFYRVSTIHWRILGRTGSEFQLTSATTPEQNRSGTTLQLCTVIWLWTSVATAHFSLRKYSLSQIAVFKSFFHTFVLTSLSQNTILGQTFAAGEDPPGDKWFPAPVSNSLCLKVSPLQAVEDFSKLGMAIVWCLVLLGDHSFHYVLFWQMEVCWVVCMWTCRHCL